MKKILLALAAVLASFMVANAQNEAALQKAVDKAVEATQNAKKAANPDTWVKLGQKYLQAYDAPTKNVMDNLDLMSAKLALKDDKLVKEEEVVVSGVQLLKQVYEDKNLYFTQNGQLAITEVTRPVVADALPKALEAFKKAQELDKAGKKAKDITEGFRKITSSLFSEASNAFNLGDFKSSLKGFQDVVAITSGAPLNQTDTLDFTNGILAASRIGDFASMTDLCKKSLDVNYYGDNGSIFARFAEATEQLDTSETGRLAARKILEEGIAKFPASQDITIGLINNYNKGGEDSDKVFQLLDRAKANDPTNASLYSFTGEVLAQVGRYDDAVKAFNDCIAKFPDYEWGYIGMGNLYAKISNEANEKMNDSSLDNNAYNKLVEEKLEAIKGCIENYEKAFELTKDEALKANLASSLKSNNFMLRDEDPKYMAAYEKYKAYEEGAK